MRSLVLLIILLSARLSEGAKSSCLDLIAQVETHEGKSIKVPVTSKRPELDQSSNFAKKQHPSLTGLSGNLVPVTALKKAIGTGSKATIYQLFTCKSCNKHNQIASPIDAKGDGGKESIVCGNCANAHTGSQNDFYNFAKDPETGRSIGQLVDVAQFATPEAAKAPMWVCSYCDSKLIGDEDPYCPSCTERMGNQEARKEIADAAEALEKSAHAIKHGQTPEGRALLAGEAAGRKFSAALKSFPDLGKKSLEHMQRAPAFVKQHILKVSVVLGMSLAAAASWYFFFDTQDWPATLVGTSWERTIEYEIQKSVPEEDWCDSVPFGATNVNNLGKRRYSFKSEQEGKANFLAGVNEMLLKIYRASTFLPILYADTDNNNGTFTFDGDSGSSSGGGNGSSSGTYVPTPLPEPVYKDWCSYNIVKWVFSRRETSGKSNPRSASDIYWPRGGAGLGERESLRKERYTRNFDYVVAENTRRNGDQNVSMSELFSLPTGTTGIASVTRVGQVRSFVPQQLER